MTSNDWRNVRRCLREREATAATELEARRCAAAMRSIDRRLAAMQRLETVEA